MLAKSLFRPFASLRIFLRKLKRKEKEKVEAPKLWRWKLALGILQIDNLEDAVQTIEKADKLLFTAEIGRILEEWTEGFHGFLQKYDEEKYLLLLDNSALREIEAKKFNLLDLVRSLDLGNKIPVTISLGIGLGADNLAQLGEYAQSALNVALGRGGDQAVIKEKDQLRFYGGKTRTPEKRTRIRARVIAHALGDLIGEASRVVIMGHKELDLDSLGSAIGLASIVRPQGKETYIILDKKPSNALLKLERSFALLDEFSSIFIQAQEAIRLIDEQTLLIVVDTHKPSLLIEDKLLTLTKKIVVIDHHRQAGELLFDPILVYLEPYASSTSELVTEIVEYLDNVRLEPLEATALLAGITVDTKNFTFQTGVRTYEAASFLRRWGADPLQVRELFKSSLVSFVRQAEVVKNVEILYNAIALGVHSQPNEKAQLVAAQTADILLNIEGIEASFVLCPAKDGVVVSARSWGKINVQVILERIGGGGHLMVAGAQIPGVKLPEAKERVKKIIEEYWREERKES